MLLQLVLLNIFCSDKFFWDICMFFWDVFCFDSASISVMSCTCLKDVLRSRAGVQPSIGNHYAQEWSQVLRNIQNLAGWSFLFHDPGTGHCLGCPNSFVYLAHSPPYPTPSQPPTAARTPPPPPSPVLHNGE